ncbi:hypothetical protein BGW38_008283, partial [Lunasporangiospora selenospora]
MPRKYGATVYVRNKWPLMLRIKGTVLLRIWWQVIVIGIYSTAVFLIHNYTSWKMNYSLGRRLWSQMTLGIRNLTRCIWVCVAENETRDLLEKKSAVNLLVAFAFSTKHYLREEYGYNYDDMAELLLHIPKYALPTSTQPMDWRSDVHQVHQLDSLRHQSHMHVHENPEKHRKSTHSTQGRARRHAKSQSLAYDFLTPTNIPIELSYYIGSYIKSCSNKELVDASTLSVMNTALVSLIDCLTGFERILRTPIPLAYSIHLQHATWIYLLAAPFQLIGSMGAFVIPACMLAAFTLLGILGIGYEIENPFNDDYNDLPLDDFCKVIKAEVDSMVARRAPVPSEWVFSERNFPLAGSKLSAKELLDMPLESIHELMAEDRHPIPTVNYSRPVAANI